MNLAHKLSRRSSDGLPDGVGGGGTGGGDRSLPTASKASMGGTPILRTPSSRRERKEDRRAKRAASRRHAAPHDGGSDSEDEAAFRADWHMSRADEKRRLREFVDHLKATGHLRTDFDFYTYRRFLRARQHDLTRATDMWTTHLEWRKQIGADTILDPGEFEFPERDAFISLYPQGYCNVDKQGRPIYIQQLGQLQFKKLTALTSEERMIKFHVQEYERCIKYIMPACSRAAGRHIDQTFAILDAKGVGLGHLTGGVKKMLQTVVQVDQNNYPEMLGKTVVINASRIISSVVFPLVRPFLDKRTQNKIEVCSSDYTAILAKYIEPENLPEYLGGKSKATLLDDAGPWNDEAVIEAIESDLRRPGPRLRLPDEPAAGSLASSVSGSSPHAPEALASPSAALPGSQVSFRITEEEESFHEAADRVRAASVTSTLSPRTAAADDDGGYESPTDGYASASEGGYWSATESLRSASQTSGAGLSQSFAARRQPRPPSSDSDDEAQSRSPAAAAVTGAAAAGSNGIAPSRQPVPQAAPAASRGPQLQQSIAARVSALEQRLGAARAGLGRRAPAVVSELGPSAPLLARVEALEAALDVVLASQQTALEEAERQKSKCCGCCTIM